MNTTTAANTAAENLKDKLQNAAQRTRLRYMVLMTIYTGLQRGKVSTAGALDWLKGEGLLSEVE
jgi:hypothetical protein